MHFTTLVTAEIPEIEENPLLDDCVKEEIEELKKVCSEKNGLDRIMPRIFLEDLLAKRTPFGRAVVDAADELLAPFSEQTENPEYLEFFDMTEELQERYETETADCFKTPDGRIVETGDPVIDYRFVIRDGKVYQRAAGPFHREKRTKKARKLTAMPSYPVKKLYKSYPEYAESRGYFLDEETKKYGYRCNPRAFYDWYRVGGRWPYVFLVKETVKDCTDGVHDLNDSMMHAPEGYKWVCAARKKDIEWQVMFEERKASEIKNYELLKKAFLEKKLPKQFWGSITEKGIESWDRILYRNGETLDEYLVRYALSGEMTYPDFAYGYLHEGEYFENSEFETTTDPNGFKVKTGWREEIANLIDDLDADTVLICVDCHI